MDDGLERSSINQVVLVIHVQAQVASTIGNESFLSSLVMLRVTTSAHLQEICIHSKTAFVACPNISINANSWL